MSIVVNVFVDEYYLLKREFNIKLIVQCFRQVFSIMLKPKVSDCVQSSNCYSFLGSTQTNDSSQSFEAGSNLVIK